MRITIGAVCVLAGAALQPRAVAIAAPSASKAAAPAAYVSADKQKPRTNWVILADQIYTAPGRVVSNGMITVTNGKISSVTVGPAGDLTPDTTLKAFAVTAGMIDASVRIDTGRRAVEESREIAPDMRAQNTVDFDSLDWDRQVRGGVTTVLVNPPDFNVVGGLGVVLKTGGDESVAARKVRADAVLRGAMGTQPSMGNHPAFGRPRDFFSRRPTTRMGVEWEWRKAFYDTAASQRDATRAFPGSDRLLAVLKGELPLFVQAWTTQDIRTAVFLKEELEREGLGHPRLILDAAAEAWKEPELLVRSKTAVVLPPFPPEGRTGEGSFMAWDVAARLHERGVVIALSSHGQPGVEDRLAMQAGYAMRGGLPFDAALAAVTVNPAKLLEVDDRVGTVEVGKDADLVLWSGTPFEPASRIVGVVLDGVLRVDPRPKE